MRNLFCNECGLSYEIPHLVAERLLGVEYLHRIESRYEQMRKCYDCTCAEWQGVFTEDLKPFGGYDDTTSVTISRQQAYNDCCTRPIEERQVLWRML